MRFPALIAALAAASLFLGCSGEDEATPGSKTPGATPEASSPAVSATTAAAPIPEITGLFTDPRPRQADDVFFMTPRPLSPFKPWDRESVVLYDIEQGTEVTFGPGVLPSFSPEAKKLAFSPLQGSTGPTKVRVVDLVTKASQEFESNGGSASFVDENHLYMPASGEVRVLDIRSGVVTSISQVTDPVLKAKLEGRATGTGPMTGDSKYRLKRPLDDEKQYELCSRKPGGEQEICRAEAFEQWTVEEVATGRIVLQFYALEAGLAGKGELVIATSPQCQSRDGSEKWCPEVLAELRADDDSNHFQIEYAEGTTNIFILEIASGRATFVATARYRPNTNVTPSNWPLIADEAHVVWTGAFCSDQQEKTRILDRKTLRISEINASLWVEFTATGDLGVDEFGPRAILDINTLRWKIVLPDNVVDVVESPDGRYLAVGGVLGHGGLCG